MKVTYKELMTAKPVLEKMAGDTKAGMKASLKIYKVLKELEFSFKEFADLRNRTANETRYGELIERPVSALRQELADRSTGSISEGNMTVFQKRYSEILLQPEAEKAIETFEKQMEEIILEETECKIQPLKEADISSFSDLSSFDLLNLGPFLKV